jgi:tetratricopeptide (TPR) repeat protein
MLGWTKWAIALAIAGLAMCGASPVRAGDSTVAVQRLGPPEIEARREALLRQMLADPSNLDVAFEYAKLSSQVGDYEGAISALERMLIYAPNTARIQLELGVLYYRLGAYDVARAYFEQALANPSVPPNVANQIRLYLQQLALAADPPAFSATIFSAIRWESNANSGPATQNVTLNGFNFTLDQNTVGKSGWSALNIGTLHYGFDLKIRATGSARRARLQHRLFRFEAQRHRSRFLRGYARAELQHEALGLGHDARLCLRHRRSRLSRL